MMFCQKEEPLQILQLLGIEKVVVYHYIVNTKMSRPHSTEYEVLRVEGCEETPETPQIRKTKKGKGKRSHVSESPSIISPTKIKKLKLCLGSETMSTVNYSDE